MGILPMFREITADVRHGSDGVRRSANASPRLPSRERRLGFASALAPRGRQHFRAGMWLDPSTGKFYEGKPGEWAGAVRSASPLLRKAYLHPDQLTPDEIKQVQLELVSTLSNLLPDATLRELLDKKGNLTGTSDPAHEQAAHQVLEGKLALREMGAVKEKRPEMALLNPQTGQILTESDAERLLKERRAERAKRAKATRKKKR